MRSQEWRAAPLRQALDDKASAPARRISLWDAIALLLFLGWCGLGVVKVARDVADYRAQQAAISAFNAAGAPLTAAMTAARAGGGAPAARIPYDPERGKWLMGEVIGYLVTLAVVAVGSYRAGQRRPTVRVKWIAAPRQHAVGGTAPGVQRQTAAQSGNVAAERLSVVVWTDRVVRFEKERA